MLLDFDVFGFGLAPLLLRSDCCFSGDGLIGSDLIFGTPSKRTDVVGLVTGSFFTLSNDSLFWLSLPFTDVRATKFGFEHVLAVIDVLVTAVALDVVFTNNNVEDDDDDGAILEKKKKSQETIKSKMFAL